MKRNNLRTLALLLAILTFAAWAVTPMLSVAADGSDDAVYLGDRRDLFIKRESLDDFGWNTAHSGEPITVGSRKFDKGLGMHCLPDKNAYVEFDISSLDVKYFSAYVGLLQEASYFMEWGSVSFHVYGDGELLASSPVMNWGNEPYFLSCSVEGVKTLRLEQNNDGSHACDAGVWGNALLTNVEPKEEESDEVVTELDPDKTNEPQPVELVSGDTAYASDLYWMDNKTYSGNVVGRDCNTANEIIFSTDGKFFEKGVGFHATSGDYTSFVDINIAGLGFTKFASYYGVCETLTGHDITMAAVKFAVFGDGQKLWESDTVLFGEAMLPMECDITGVQVLRLAVAGAPGISGAWGTWGGALLSKSGEITDDMLYADFTYDDPETTEPETNEPETNEPETNEPETNEPVTNTPETDPTTAAPTDEPTAAPTDAPATQPQETEAPKGGCGATLACGGALAVCVAAVALKKKKED